MRCARRMCSTDASIVLRGNRIGMVDVLSSVNTFEGEKKKWFKNNLWELTILFHALENKVLQNAD